MPAISGRPDGRLSKYIYADGFGGVCRDMRYSANGLTPTDFAEADQRVKNGTYRGFEKAVFTKFDRQTGSTNASQQYINVSDLTGYYIGQKIHVEVTAGSYQTFTVKGITYGALSIQLDRFAPRLQNGIMLVETESSSSIGGSFLQTDVIGSPSNILATPQLANGWQGSWIPDFTSDLVQLSRKKIDAINTYNRIYTSDNGVSWMTSSGTGGDAAANTMYYGGAAVGSNRVFICQYQAFAKQTKPSANAVVYGGQSGVGDVYISSRASNNIEGVLLAEACLGKVLTDNTAWNTNRSLAVTDVRLGDKLVNDFIWHTTPNGLLAPLNNSPLFKALNYNVVTNQQGFINYAYTELKHNGTNWGDDSKVTIVDNQSTKTDLNGNTVLVGTAQLNEPLGWIKNKV